MTDKRYCPKTGQFEDHAAGTCCEDPDLHVKPFVDIMDAYRQMAMVKTSNRRAARTYMRLMNALDLAWSLLGNIQHADWPEWKASLDRFQGQYRAIYDSREQG